MEKFKQNNFLSRNMKETSRYKFKGTSWECGDHEGGDVDLFSWPPRSYTCSFCKREFRSAQALGGHMNVHRRDRARLRQFSPPRNHFGDNGCSNIRNNSGKFPLLNLNHDPNPSLTSNPSISPTFYLSSAQHKFPHFSSTFAPLYNTSTTPRPLANGNDINMKKWGKHAVQIHNFGIDTGLMKMKARKGVLGVEKFDAFVHEKGCEVAKKEIVRLELEIGLISQSKEELDLELRLG